MYLPDGRIHGLSDAMDLITAFYIVGDRTDRESRFAALLALGSREFEWLSAHLCSEMGYDVVLTAPTKDGGRDVIATRDDVGAKERILVSCKLGENRVSVDEVDRMLGVATREPATRGVIMAPSGFTSGERRAATETARSEPRIELVDLDGLTTLYNNHLGTGWHLRLRGCSVSLCSWMA